MSRAIAATPITDACAVKSVELIHQHLKKAVFHGMDSEEREGMAYAQLLAGMAFNNASLGYVHAMAHQLGGFYDLPHGVCNAILLPHVQKYNSSNETAAIRLGHIAKALGVDTQELDRDEAAASAIDAIKSLSREIGIPSGLSELGVKEKDFPTLATNAIYAKSFFSRLKGLIGKERLMIFGSILLYKKKVIVYADWYGKLAALLLNAAIFWILILNLNNIWANSFMAIAYAAEILALILYTIRYFRLKKEAEEKSEIKE